MRPSPRALVFALAAVVAGGLPSGGCGAKRKPPKTIAMRLQEAEAQPSAEARARDLTKVARLQLRSGDRSGATSTISKARANLLPPAKPKAAPVEEPAEPEAGGEPEAGEKPAEEKPADGDKPAEGEKPAADGDKPADGEKPAEGDKPAEGEKPAADGEKPDGAEKPAADGEKAAEGDKPAADGEKPADGAEPAAKPDGEPAPPADGEAAAEPAAAEEPPPPPINWVMAAPILVDIAAVYAELGQRGAAKDLLATAVKKAAEIPDDMGRALLLAAAGGIYGARSGGAADAPRAKKTLTDAKNLVEKIEERFRAEALAAVSLGYVKAGLLKDASQLVETLEASARAVENPRAKAEALAAAGEVHAQSGDKEKATELLKDAAATAKGIDSPENRAYALVAVAEAVQGNGERKTALSLVGEAEKAAAKVADPDAQENAKARVRALRNEIERSR